MKWLKKKSFLVTAGYSLAIIAWFSYSSFYGLDMLSYTKSEQLSKSSSSYSSSHQSSVHHK